MRISDWSSDVCSSDLLLGHPVIMADRAFNEIKRHPLKGCDHTSELRDIIEQERLQVVALEHEAASLFFDLTSDGLEGGLDDGEAATIALMLSLKLAIPVLDDRKARGLLSRRWPD